MNNNHGGNNQNDALSSVNQPWHDYRIGYRHRTGNETVTHLRIGFIQYQKLLQGNNATETTLNLPASACRQHPNLRQVQIYLPGISKIGLAAFEECLALEQVEFLMKPPSEEGEEQQQEEDITLPSQLVSIGDFSFCVCKNLQNVIGLEKAKDSLQHIGHKAFLRCTSLVDVVFFLHLRTLQSLGREAFHGCESLITVDLSRVVNLTELQSHTFNFCTVLISIHLPPNLQRIGDSVFRHCHAVEQIHLPPGVQIMGQYAFQHCHKLKSIVLPFGLQQIGRFCFHDCGKLTQVVLPSVSMPFLKRRPFDHQCKSLASLGLPDQVPCQKWPLILEQFCSEDGIGSTTYGGIHDLKNRNSIVWNFLCQNMAQLFMDDNTTMSRRRPAVA